MRPIKFRAWDKESKNLCDVIDFTCMNYPDKYEVMQFTGLLDKNGVEIYEGDVLGEYMLIGDFAGGYEPYGKVYFDTDLLAFCVEQTNGGWVYLSTFFEDRLTKFSEVIGNVWEHPELLKEAK